MPGGTFIHSAIGLAPQAYILALEGGGAARRRDRRAGDPTGETGRATRLFSWTVVGLAVLVRDPVHPRRPGELAGRGEQPRRRSPTQLDRPRGADRRPRDVDRCRGHEVRDGTAPGVVSPDDPIDTIAKVAEAYDIRWLVLEDGGVEALTPVSNPR